MKLETTQSDPLNVLATTKPVVENSKFVFINEEKIPELSEKILERFGLGLDTELMGFGITGSLENDVQLIFLEDAVNFCFWADKDRQKWQVERNDGTKTEGGWYGLKTCFERAISEGIPLWDADYLSSIPIEDVKKVFRGANDTQIPLLDERAANLREAGKVLSESFGGKFISILNESEYNAIELARLIIQFFPSFRDVSKLSGKDVCFFKRAQICSNDLNYILKAHGKALSGLDKLTSFADYKLPQVLRQFGITSYEKSLEDRVDNYIEISHDSREEIEIRSATVWAVELIRQKLGKLKANDIDNTIWLISQNIQQEAKPYHRTRTIFY